MVLVFIYLRSGDERMDLGSYDLFVCEVFYDFFFFIMLGWEVFFFKGNDEEEDNYLRILGCIGFFLLDFRRTGRW